MTENEIAKVVVDVAFRIHTALGPGLLESVYEEILNYELIQDGLFVERQKPIPVFWKEVKMDVGFRADLIVERKVLLELKSVESITPLFPKITINYLKLTTIKLGLLINFNVPFIKDGIQRIVNNL